MIKKIKTIKNFGIFKNFEWDNYVQDSQGQVITLKNVNIFYGKNYSGKTTLSRILQSFEFKNLPEKFEEPEFEIEFLDNSILTQRDITNSNISVRVFNEQFILKNFRFFIDPEDSIEPFAVMGENIDLQIEINQLEQQLGKNNEGQETGLYEKLREKEKEKIKKELIYNQAKRKLDELLQKKATDRKIGIKYHAHKFGDQNYNVVKLKNDIKIVKEENFNPISNEEKERLEKLIKETPKTEIPVLQQINIDFSKIVNKTKELVERKIIKADKLEELVKDGMLNKWVKEGKKLHEEKKLRICAFCGNYISNNRWEKLERHFDEESQKLEREITQQINEIESLEGKIKHGFNNVDKNLFYSKYHDKIEQLLNDYKIISKNIIGEFEKLKQQLEARKNNILNEKSFEKVQDFTEQLEIIFNEYEKVRKESNNYTNDLKQEQTKAKIQLRLREVYDYLLIIDFDSKIKEIEKTKSELDNANNQYSELKEKIEGILKQIEEKKKLMSNEGEGAKIVNKYLKNHFGHPLLSLHPIEETNEETQGKQIKFKIFRENKIAYNLSEGEKRLIAFCYFMAKLNEDNVIPRETIVWIDDPISSLDNNHIFFIYSLIKTELFRDESNLKFKQLFITTHNLTFLKYLLRLQGNKTYLMIEKKYNKSIIKKMPKYLKNYITEFIYLFEQIYRCANEEQRDDNYHIFYNFGNNARKFLEIYLFYRFPGINESERYKKFFEEDIPTYIANRINNELSHLAGNLERGEQPIEYEEIKKEAQEILERIKKIDVKQYQSLLTSIGVSNE